MWDKNNLYSEYIKLSNSGVDVEAAMLSMLREELGKQVWDGQVDMGGVKKDEVEINDKRKYLLIRR